ncbi:MAG: deoxyribonuclease IV [Candidatus Hydrothermia bacterium]
MGILGAHISIAGGVELAPERGKSLGCESIQIFTKNQRQWFSKELTSETIETFKSNVKKHKIKKVVVHDSYLINLAARDIELLNKSREAFIDEAKRAWLLGIPFLVFHPGSNPDLEEGIKLIAESINETLDKIPDINLLLETTAGQGNAIGRTFEELARIMELVEKKERVGICFDTAHAFESGYDISNEEGYYKTFETFNSIIGLEKLKCFHLNDSKTPLGSNVDRHEHIGKGLLGLKAFELLLNDVRFHDHPMILETPGAEEFYEENLKVLRSLIRSKKRR